jgi:hypothetical protein
MSYYVPKSEKDLLRMQSDGDAEGPFLEYKSARLFAEKNDKVFESLSKEITAFGNAAGGAIIIGVEEDSDRRIAEIKPVTDESKTDSWIENGLLPRISPTIALKINAFDVAGGRIFVIDVPASSVAPHQAGDKRYYARRLYRVDPLLDFEVNDIRRRVSLSPLNVSLSLSFSDGLINFTIKNEGILPVYDISIDIDGIDNKEIAEQWTPPLLRPYSEPFRVLYPDSEHHFLGSGFDFFKKKLSDAFTINLIFNDSEGQLHKKSYEHFLEDYESRQQQRTISEKLLAGIEKQLSGLNESLKDLVRVSKSMQESAVHPSGLNLSKTTLSALSGDTPDLKWPGEYLSIPALVEVLEIDHEVAHKIYSELYGQNHFVGGHNTDLTDLDVPEDVKEKIRKKLRITLD